MKYCNKACGDPWDRLLDGPHPRRCRRYGRLMGGNLKILDDQMRLMFNIIFKIAPELRDTILFKILCSNFALECSFKIKRN